MSLAALPTLFVVPPLNGLVAACAGAFLYRRRAGRVLLGVGLSVLVLLSLPLIAHTLLFSLERGLPSLPEAFQPPGAIVILSGDETMVQHKDGAAFTVGLLTLERERAGAQIARRTGLPVLVTGGQIEPGSVPIAELMAISLREDFGITPRWTENSSADTWENAANSAVILRDAGIHTVILVTSAWHMRRALMAFRAAGLPVAPALVDPLPPPRITLENLVPSTTAWQQSFWALHEWIGCAWYSLRG